MKRRVRKIRGTFANYEVEIQLGSRVYKGLGKTPKLALKNARFHARQIYKEERMLQGELARYRKKGYSGTDLASKLMRQGLRSLREGDPKIDYEARGTFSRRPVRRNPARFITTGEKELRVLRALRRAELEFDRKVNSGAIQTQYDLTHKYPALFRRLERLKHLHYMVEHRHKTRPTVHRNPIPAAVWAGVEAAPYVYAAGEATYHAGRAGLKAWRKYKSSRKKRSRR